MKIEFGLQIKTKNDAHKKALRQLRPTINGWAQSISKFCEDGDAPYHYNERANISLLAAGAWKGGAVALEEYPTRKKRESDHHDGRCDLLIIVGNQYDFQMEAKHCWLRASMTAETIKGRVYKSLDKALEDAGCNTESTARIGCVFFPVSFPTSHFPQYKSDPDNLISEQIKRCVQCDADLWAWCFPEGARCLKERETNGDNRYWPGVIMGMKAGRHFRL